ncbi:36791_t:CDS:2 [Gigaspora margarita]|uniref:36791_t:CDS:1 n=1 Tax=Gigaspora margarita TaxID=4874 RepID=A0ABN7V053_GIGMA|nr:36791_t:CDS:2 [Gigaspora margarita]
MRDMIWNNDFQSMIIEDNYFIYDKKKIYLCGQPKEADPDNINCCAHRLIANQADFLAEHGQIQKEIESKGHKVIFYPKFHSEFNYIEMYWGATKKYTQTHCEYSLPKLKRSIIEAFDSISIEQMDAYRQGLTGKAAKYAVKKNKKHRMINEEIINWVNNELLN